MRSSFSSSKNNLMKVFTKLVICLKNNYKPDRTPDCKLQVMIGHCTASLIPREFKGKVLMLVVTECVSQEKTNHGDSFHISCLSMGGECETPEVSFCADNCKTNC